MLKKEKTELIITSFLVLVLVLFVLRATNKTKKKGPLPTAPVVALANNDKVILSSESGYNFSALEKETANLELKDDPFTSNPITNKRIDATGISLKGIIWDKNKPVALINEEVVKVGDSISGYSVKEIDKDKVILTGGVNITTLKLE
jgi:hypothetical protein